MYSRNEGKLEMSNKDELYNKIETELLEELFKYVSSCLKTVDLNSPESFDEIECTRNFSSFASYRIEKYKKKLKKERENANNF